jgi:glutathione peroxidase-family protein
MKIIKSTFILFLLSPLFLFAQKKDDKTLNTLISANNHFNNLEYYLAAREYSSVLKVDSNNAYAMYQLAECFRYYFDYKSAEKFYCKVADRFGKQFPLARFWYAVTLKDNGKNEQAKENFKKYREEHTDTDLETELYREKAYQEMVGIQLILVERDIPKNDFGLKCLPKPVNSRESDYSPVFFENDNSIVITSSRRGSIGGHKDNSLGGAFTDVYRFQKYNDSVWNVTKSSSSDGFSKLNTQYNESSGSFTGDKKKYYFTRCDEIIKVDKYEEFNCSIFVSYLENGKWGKAVKLNENINPPGQWNSQPSVSPDGKFLVFCSKRPGGLGLHDIWFSKCSGDDNWGTAYNMGNKVNTLFIDVSPQYYSEQNVLFFSSSGQGGYGGLDIFMADGKDEFQTVYNLGYPFNSNRDDFYFSLGDKKGYITSNREGAIGNDDIYSFNFESKTHLIDTLRSHKTIIPSNPIYDTSSFFIMNDSLSIRDSPFYSFKMKALDGTIIDFSKYRGKKVLIVNVASKCGNTPQYEDLQKLHLQYGDKLVVLGFPCNQFGAQEPGTNAEIGEFCKKNYGVTFQLFEKIDIMGENQHPLYQWLNTISQNGWNDKKIPSWNFCKYLINEKGEFIDFYASTVNPLSEQLIKHIK